MQPGVTGIENVEFGVPRLAANGAAMRINYQIDGNTNTEKDRAGLRLLPMSEVMIQEVKVVTTGFAPEFGQTMGMVYNAVTPSGTNTFQGRSDAISSAATPFSAFPFFFGCGSTTPADELSRRSPSNAVRPETTRRYRDSRRRRADREEQAVLLRRLGADAPRPVVERASSPSTPAIVAQLGRQTAAGRGAERPDGEVRDRQGRLPDRREQPR